MRVRGKGFVQWWQVSALIAVVIVVSGGAMVFAAREQRAGDPDHVDCKQVKCVALTFDDGPTPFTDRLLKVLTADGAKATFFSHREQGGCRSRRRAADYRRRHGDRQPHLGTPEYEHNPRGRHRLSDS